MSIEIAKIVAEQKSKKALSRAQCLALVPDKDYSDGRTKQSFADETDINKILQRAQSTGTISHLAKHEGVYSDYADFDFLTAQVRLSQGREIFDDLPSELRNEFNHSPAAFFKYVNDPANKARLAQLLPALALPGRQNVTPNNVISADETKAAVTAATPSSPVGAPDSPAAPSPDSPAPPSSASATETT